ETNAKLAACAGASTCKISDDLTLSKIGNYWTTPTMTKDQWGGVDPDSKIPAYKNKCFINGSWVKSKDGYCYGNSYYDGAKKYCESQGLRLPTVSELRTLQSTCSTNGLGCDGFFWSSELLENSERDALLVDFYDVDGDYFADRDGGSGHYNAFCVGD
ncbi:hypothetical protein IJ732_02085, partial [bacterium]|nr:hypothetical protein [bacterium]